MQRLQSQDYSHIPVFFPPFGPKSCKHWRLVSYIQGLSFDIFSPFLDVCVYVYTCKYIYIYILHIYIYAHTSLSPPTRTYTHTHKRRLLPLKNPRQIQKQGACKYTEVPDG